MNVVLGRSQNECVCVCVCVWGGTSDECGCFEGSQNEWGGILNEWCRFGGSENECGVLQMDVVLGEVRMNVGTSHEWCCFG